MRKLLLILAILLPTIARAGDFIKIAEYSNGGKTYDITADAPNKKGKFTIFLYVQSNTSGGCCLEIDSKNIDKFHDALLKVKEKYVEWSSIAKENKVESFKKTIDIQTPGMWVSWYYGDKWWDSDYEKVFKPYFSYLKSENGDPGMAYVYYEFKVPSDNRFIVSDANLMFITPDQIDKLANVLNYEKLLESARKVHSKADLFK